jgi:hypothetical protein
MSPDGLSIEVYERLNYREQVQSTHRSAVFQDSGRIVGHSSITRRRRPTDSDRKTTGKVRIARQPPRTPKSGNFLAAVLAECVGDLATVNVSVT